MGEYTRQENTGGRSPNDVTDQYEGWYGVNSDIRLEIIDMFVTDKRNFRVEMINQIQTLEDGVTVDVGCGNGTLIQSLRARCKTNCMMIGIDIDNSSLWRARDKEKNRKLIPSNYLKADINHVPLPIRDESVDSVLCSFTAHHANDPEMFLSEIWRMLKIGGQLVISANSKAQKLQHRILLQAIADYYHIRTPRVFAETFSAENALELLSRFFTVTYDETKQRQQTEMVFSETDFGYLQDSLMTYKTSFFPPIFGSSRPESTPPLGQRPLWREAIENVVKPRFDQLIEKQGYFSDNIDRSYYICTKTGNKALHNLQRVAVQTALS